MLEELLEKINKLEKSVELLLELHIQLIWQQKLSLLSQWWSLNWYMICFN